MGSPKYGRWNILLRNLYRLWVKIYFSHSYQGSLQQIFQYLFKHWIKMYKNVLYCCLILQDTQWNDIDYMHKLLDWTYDTTRFGGLPDVVADLHKNGQHYVMIIVSNFSNVSGFNS